MAEYVCLHDPACSTSGMPGNRKAHSVRCHNANAAAGDLPVLHVHHHDIEKHADSYNQGYADAETQLQPELAALERVRALCANARRHSGGSFVATVDILSIERALDGGIRKEASDRCTCGAVGTFLNHEPECPLARTVASGGEAPDA